jgi:hypothetical protein
MLDPIARILKVLHPTMNSITTLMASHNTEGAASNHPLKDILTMNSITTLMTPHNTEGTDEHPLHPLADAFLGDPGRWLENNLVAVEVCYSPTGCNGTVRVFRQKFTLEDAIGSHACSLEVNMRATNGILLLCPLLLPVGTSNYIQTLKGGVVTVRIVAQRLHVLQFKLNMVMLLWLLLEPVTVRTFKLGMPDGKRSFAYITATM